MPTIEQARAWYPGDDPVHGFDHVLRVYRIAETIAKAEKADLEIVRTAVLLHDAEDPAQTPGSFGPDERCSHQHTSAQLAGRVLEKEGWPGERIEAVQHCIRAHRFRDGSEPPLTLEARILFDADKLDAIGAIGVARAVAYASRAHQPAYAQPSPNFLASGQTGPGEPHSAFHEYLFKLRRRKDLLFTPTARAVAEERHQFLVAFFDRLELEVRGDDLSI